LCRAGRNEYIPLYTTRARIYPQIQLFTLFVTRVERVQMATFFVPRRSPYNNNNNNNNNTWCFGPARPSALAFSRTYEGNVSSNARARARRRLLKRTVRKNEKRVVFSFLSFVSSSRYYYFFRLPARDVTRVLVRNMAVTHPSDVVNQSHAWPPRVRLCTYNQLAQSPHRACRRRRRRRVDVRERHCGRYANEHTVKTVRFCVFRRCISTTVCYRRIIISGTRLAAACNENRKLFV